MRKETNMSRGLILGFLAMAMAGTLPALDLTVHTLEVPSGSGGSFRKVYVEDGKQKIMLSPDAETIVGGRSGEALFQFTDLNGAQLMLRLSPFAPGAGFKGAEMHANYRQVALKFAPDGVLKRTEGRVEEDVKVAGRWDGCRFHFTYELPGQQVAQSVTFANFTPSAQVAIVLTAFGGDLKKAQERSEKLLSSWHEVTDAQLEAVPHN